jgi:large subunit ribosomal protein L21
MFAVVEIAGQQVKVEKDGVYYVPRLQADIDSEVTFDNVYLVGTGKKTKVGSPTVEGAMVSAKVLEHLKDDKVIVFKKKRRKTYQVRRGHRQQLTRIEVTKIS